MGLAECRCGSAVADSWVECRVAARLMLLATRGLTDERCQAHCGSLICQGARTMAEPSARRHHSVDCPCMKE